MAIKSYSKLSQEHADDIQMIYWSVQDLQDQVDSLAEVVLQNRRGPVLLIANKGGICLIFNKNAAFMLTNPE